MTADGREAAELHRPRRRQVVHDAELELVIGVVGKNRRARSDYRSIRRLFAVGTLGGLSGKPLAKRSTEVIRFLSQKSKKAFPIIGVGGIHSAEDAIEKLEAGACLVQLYTGFIYEGPALVKAINKEILKRLQPQRY